MPWHVGRAEALVVRVARRAADPATGHAADELLAGHVDEDRGRDPLAALGERLVERLGLHARPREAVEDHAAGRVVPGEPLEEQADGDLVGHELARVHVPARFHAQRRAVADGRPEQVAGRHHGDPEAGGEQRRLGALPGAGGAEEDDRIHGRATAAQAAIIG